MPVRARSRLSSSPIQARASRAPATSSRRASLHEGRISPPSRRTSGGSSTSARSRSSRRSSRASSSSARLARSPPADVGTARRSSPRGASETRSPTRSRAWATRIAARPASRSMSPTRSSPRRTASRAAGATTSAWTASWRWRIASGSRSGRSSHWRRSRAPIGVRVRLRAPKSAVPSSRVSTADASIVMDSVARRGWSRVRWPRAWPLVSRRYASAPAAAWRPTVMPATPKASSVGTLKWARSASTPGRRAKVVGSQKVSTAPRAARRSQRLCSSRSGDGRRISAGRRTSAASRSSGPPSPTQNSPVEMSVRASPSAARPWTSASRKLLAAPSRKAVSVTVPGVMIRTTSRRRSFLPRPGASICSQRATFCPARTSRAM